MPKEEEFKIGYCKIENKTTRFRKGDNGRWMCTTCDYNTGYDEPKLKPKEIIYI